MKVTRLLTVALLAVSLAGCSPAAEPEACPDAPERNLSIPPPTLEMRLSDASEVLVAQVTAIGDDEVTLTIVEPMKGSLVAGNSIQTGLTSSVWTPVVGETSLWLLTGGPEFCATSGGARGYSPEEAAGILERSALLNPDFEKAAPTPSPSRANPPN